MPTGISWGCQPFPVPPLLKGHLCPLALTGHSSHRAEPLPQHMASQLDESHCPAQPPGCLPADQAPGGGAKATRACLEPLSAGAWFPTVPWGQIYHLVAALHQAGAAGGSSGPSATGRWEPIMAIFNLIKAVSTIDFSSFNY